MDHRHRAPPRARGKPKAGEANYWSKAMANGWTPERRAQQAKLIRQWRPWKKATGPKSAAGKARCARNAFKGGARPNLRELARVLRAQRRGLAEWR
jgi:hypothetical protein